MNATLSLLSFYWVEAYPTLFSFLFFLLLSVLEADADIDPLAKSLFESMLAIFISRTLASTRL